MPAPSAIPPLAGPLPLALARFEPTLLEVTDSCPLL